MKKKQSNKVDIRKLFLGFQKSMIEDLKTIRENVDHEPTKGDGAELIWIKFFRDYLPKRYCVDKAKIIDYEGNTSDAIDVVIYDRQYTPFVMNKSSIKYIPSESVYAVFEAKQDIDKGKLDYASNKIASVRELDRTTAPVVERGEIRPAPSLFKIMGGFLCLDNTWKDSLNICTPFKNCIQNFHGDHFIDIGCVLNDMSFKIDIEDKEKPIIQNIVSFSTKEETLIFFFLKLLSELQKLGTVRPMDVNKYIDQLNSQ